MPPKGHRLSDETRRKLSLAATGRKHSAETRAKMSLASAARRHTPETKAKLSEAAKRRDLSAFIEGSKRTRFETGHAATETQKAAARLYNASRVAPMKGKRHSGETRRKISQSLIGNQRSLGRKESESTRFKKRVARLGDKNPAWVDGRTFISYSREFLESIRHEIKRRDNYTCQDCGRAEGECAATLNVHHIDTDRQNNNADNLISLCDSCHRKRHNDISRKRKANKAMPS